MRSIESIYDQVRSVPDFSGLPVVSVDCRNGYGDTPLHIVSCWGDCEAIDILVEAGADLNAVGESGFTPLHYAVEQNKLDAIAKLLQLGSTLDCASDAGNPVELAKLLGHMEAISVLMQRI